MAKKSFNDAREFKAWNDSMVAKYDLEQFYAHPSPFVRYVEGKRIRRIFALLAPEPHHRVLEVGCGAGHLLAELPAGQRFGLDLSETLLAKTARRLDGRGGLVQSDAQHLPFRDCTWDRAYCSEVLEHVPDPRAAIAELCRVLGPRGIAVLSIPNERLINALKTALHKTRLYDLLMRAKRAGYSMPERMDDEWHLHTFDLHAFRALIPASVRVTAVEGVPFSWVPLHYVVRCEVPDRLARKPTHSPRA